MNKKIEFNSSVGPIKICTVWDFLLEVKKQYVPEIHQEIRINRTMENLPPYAGLYADLVYLAAETSHILKQNPSSILVELKKTTTLKEKKSKSVNCFELLTELSLDSGMNMGIPTHFFSVGKNRYALVCEQDIILFVNKNYKQSLVCVNKRRNFTVYAPNLKVSGL